MLAWGGGSIRRNGVYDEVCAALRATGRKIVEFSGIMSNPTYKKVLEGAALARKENVGLIIAVGGGSVMDCCKAISIAARYDGDVWNDFWAKKGSFRGVDPLPLGIVVTVSGTGSECNGGAVITNEDLHMKTGRDYPECNARFSLLDPAYTFSVPRFQMVAGAFDTLSHLMEIYFLTRTMCPTTSARRLCAASSAICGRPSVTKRITRPEAISCGTPPWPRTAW